MDRLHYKYNCYHFNVHSLDPKSLSIVKTASSIISKTKALSGFGGCIPSIKVQPLVTNLLSADDTDPEPSVSITIVPLDWEFC